MKIIEIDTENYFKLELKPIFKELDVTYCAGGQLALKKISDESFFDGKIIHIPFFDQRELSYYSFDTGRIPLMSGNIIMFSGDSIVGHLKLTNVN
jgi:hypothetical protein